MERRNESICIPKNFLKMFCIRFYRTCGEGKPTLKKKSVGQAHVYLSFQIVSLLVERQSHRFSRIFIETCSTFPFINKNA